MASTKDIAQTKVLNRSGGKNNLRFASSSKRSAEASADVYRNFKRQSVLRETAVHHDRETDESLSFGEELDLCLDRNASEVFRFFYTEVWPFARSLPEVLHHTEQIVSILLKYLLAETTNTVHHGTLDILHLIAVLSRQLRDELHNYVHSKLLPRILVDLLQSDPQLDVSYVEAAFRTVAYILKYDTAIKDLDTLLPYYGTTMAGTRPVVRRLAAETFGPVIRQQTKKACQHHLKRILKVVGNSSHSNTSHAVDGVALLFAHVARQVYMPVVLDTLIQKATALPVVMEVAALVLDYVRVDKEQVWKQLLSTHTSDAPTVVLRLLGPPFAKASFLRPALLDQVEKLLRLSFKEWGMGSLATSPAMDLCIILCNRKKNTLDDVTRWTGVLQPYWESVAHRFLAEMKVSLPLAMPTLVSSILSHPWSPSSCLDIVYKVACLGATDDDTFHIDHAAHCKVPIKVKNQLLDYFLDAIKTSSPKDKLTGASVMATLKTVTFAAFLPADNSCLKRVASALIPFLDMKVPADDLHCRFVVATSLECLTLLLQSDWSILTSKIIKRISGIAKRALLAHAESLVVIKSVAGFAKLLQQHDHTIFDVMDTDTVFELLAPNLRSDCHFLRLHCLKILSTLPKRPFVVDHTDLDLADDLDEDADVAMEASEKTKVRAGLCGLIENLLEIESSTPNLQNERSVTLLISSVGNMGQSGRLPVVYAEAAANHLMGTLYTKYSPLWTASVKALVSLAQGHPNSVVPYFQDHIAEVMAIIPYQQSQATAGTEETAFSSPSSTWEGDYDNLVTWELTKGVNTTLFHSEVEDAKEQGIVSRFDATDNLSVCSSLWRVAEEAPLLMTRRSEIFVPVFLRFLCFQYFALNPNDPDARELNLSKHLEDHGDCVIGKPLDSRAILRRLHCGLKALAAVSKPKGVFKQDVLLSTFVVFSSHQDLQIARTAFSCVLKYKLPYVSPYAEILCGLYEKGKLRDSMMKLKEASEDQTILADHRQQMAPILARILYGRLGSRATSAKSSKDSPEARRNAVLSFLSAFTDSKDELYPFLYLVMRAYLLPEFQSRPLEDQTPSYQQSFLEAVSSVAPEHCAQLPVQVNQGFLNTVEAIITQLGRKVSDTVPTMLGIVLAILKAFEVSESSSTNQQDNEHNTEVAEHHEGSQDPADHQNSRSGSVRSLCYRRVGEIFGNYSSVCSLTQYQETFWVAAERSLALLPQMAASATRVPALLGLMKTISQLEETAPMLVDRKDCVPSILRCLAATSKPAIVDAVLVIVDGLLTCEESTGRSLLRPYIALLLEQFRLRFECKTRASTWRMELDILCKASKILEEGADESSGSTIESLCSLLAPFLDPSGFGGDMEKQQVVEILLSLVDKISLKRAEEIFLSLSSYLGISKGAQGLVSKKLRFALAAVISKMSLSVLPSSKLVGEATMKLCSINEKKLNEIDFDSVLSCLAGLGSVDKGDQNWNTLSMQGDVSDPMVSLPVLNCCFHSILEDDGVVSRAAFKAVRMLISVCCAKVADEDQEGAGWKRFLEGSLVPAIRGGLVSRNEAVRRFFVLLLRDVIQQGHELPSEHIHRDLAGLVRDDEPDLDFFHSITHVQLHRRARALQRLRKTVSNEGSMVTSFSISKVLLPLAMHSIFESKTKLEESFALEGIATAGALARHLSWSKYNSALSTHLYQFERSVDQEKYLVALICSLIDAFHFDVGESDEANSVRRTLEKRLIPMIEKMLTKETKENKSSRKGKALRPAIALALLKLIQKLPKKSFEDRLQRLLVVICNVLSGKDSTARETARTTIGKMVEALDVVYVSDVVRELAISLREGFRVHVRTAAMHTILLQLSSSYLPPRRGEPLLTQPAFDSSVAGFIDLIQQDLFGVAQERKEAKESHVRFVQEAQGSKAAHCLELLSSMIYFSPVGDERISNSVRTVVAPFLERLRSPTVLPKVVGRVRECLSRIVAGLLKNPSIVTIDLLAFVRINMIPFVKQSEIDSVENAMNDEEGDGETNAELLQVSGGQGQSDVVSRATKGSVSKWQPSLLNISTSVSEANSKKNAETAEISRVQDGASAPKLTGSNRNRSQVDETAQKSVNSPQSLRAISFCLSLLSRKLKSEAKTIPESLLDPFVPLLTTCACCCRDTEVSMLALKCLAWLLRTKLPALARCSKALAAKTLDLLVSSGEDEEQRQLAFKMLTSLLIFDKRTEQIQTSMPLSPEQMQVLMSFVRESMERGDQYNQAISLLKSIMSRKFISPELYDLMDVLLRQTVQSSKSNLRQQSGNTFISFLINYPLSSERVEEYLKQVVANLKYAHAAGRLSAIHLTANLIEKLPEALLEKHCQLFFFPLTLQLANDESSDCKESINTCLGKMFGRMSSEVVQPLYDYANRWSAGNHSLQRTSLQLFRLFADSKPEFTKKRLSSLLGLTNRFMKETSEWEIVYFSAILVEKLAEKCSRAKVDEETVLWKTLVEVMSSRSHPWVQLVCCRLIASHILPMDPKLFHEEHVGTFLLERNSSHLFQLGQSLCCLLDSGDYEKSDELITLATKCLTWTIPAMDAHHELCGLEENPVERTLKRLSIMAKPKGPSRQTVFKCFAALSSKCFDCIIEHIELLIEPLYRVELECRNISTNSNSFSAEIVQETISDEEKLAKDVMFLLEEQCSVDDTVFLNALAAVKKQARDKKDQRKALARAEAVTDPQRYAQRRVEKQRSERERRKRRVDEKRQERGAQSKRRRS